MTKTSINCMTHQPLVRVTVTLPRSLAERLDAFRVSQRFSVSSIIEHAVTAYFEHKHENALNEDLLARGASRRRKRVSA